MYRYIVLFSVLMLALVGFVHAEESLPSKTAIMVTPEQVFVLSDGILVCHNNVFRMASELRSSDDGLIAMIEVHDREVDESQLAQSQYARCPYCRRLFLLHCRTPGCPGNPNS